MRRLLVTVALTVPLGCSVASLRAQEVASGGLQAGAAAVNISPVSLPALRNGGFLQATSNRMDDPLFARCLVLSDGAETIALAVVDSCMLPTTLCDEIKRIVMAKTEIAMNRIAICSTHTHSAPSAMAYTLGCGRDDGYTDYVVPLVAQAVIDANRGLQPAKLGYAAVDAADLTNCRRWITRSDRKETDPFGDLSVRAMMHPGYENPNYVCPAGPIDPWLSLLSVVSAADETPICTMANFSMHYFGAGRGFSADYFGDVARLLEARVGKTHADEASNFVAIQSQGTSGDLHWMDYNNPRRDISRQQYSAAVAERAVQAWKTIEYRSDVTLAMAEKRLTLRRRIPTRERLEWARPINGNRPSDVPPRDKVEVYAQQAEWIQKHQEAEVVLQAIRIGELGITAIPNEVYGITGLKLKRQSPLPMTFNLELANGAEGYIPPPEQHRLGGYTTWPARTAGLEQQAEPTIVLALLELLEAVAAKPRRPLSSPSSAWSRAVTEMQPIAYWRLDDMTESRAVDAVGKYDANYQGGIALYLPGPSGSGFTSSGYGNRSVYLAGGHIEARVAELTDPYSVSMWFWNGLPTDAREITGTLLSVAGETLQIDGTAAGEEAGCLVLHCGQQSLRGSRPVTTKGWHQVTITRTRDRVRVYLDGHQQPDIDGLIPSPSLSEGIYIGSDSASRATFDGKIDEVALFDRALTVREVRALYTVSGQTPPPLPQPTRASRALDTIRVHDGFEAQLVAAEPLVMDPVAIDWGPDGKLWVVEMADYPLGLDGQGQPGGRVRFLEDTTGDGKYDSSTLFADGLSFPTGVLAWRNGILVTAAPQIVYLEDTTGDGKADLQRVLYSGFLEGNQQLRVNGLRWGLDNWVYCASGSHHAGYGKNSRIVSHLLGSEHQIGSRDFRIRPDSGAIDPQSGPSQYGRNRDDWGNWFGVQNSHPLWHYVLSDHNIRRNPHYAPPDPKVQLVTPTNPPVYPISKLQKRFHSFEQSGRFTSACSAMIYRDTRLFDELAKSATPEGPQHAFTCEPFHNLVQHNIITHAGVSFQSHREPSSVTQADFFASDDRWCRPVMVRTGPDGALWVVDMYRYMIEHPQWLPKNGQEELRPWFRSGEDRGRIYRVVGRGAPNVEIPRLDADSPQKLVSALQSTNGWHRDMAQRLLLEMRSKECIPSLKTLAREGSQPWARLHALWTLEGLGALETSTLEEALSDRHAGVRQNAVRLAARGDVQVDKLSKLVDDPDAKVRLALASTLGAYEDPAASTALANLALQSHTEPYITASVMSSLNQANVTTVLAAVLASDDRRSQPLALELVTQAVALSKRSTIAGLIDLVLPVESSRHEAWQFSVLTQLLDGLAKRNWSIELLADQQRSHLAGIATRARIAAAQNSTPEDLRLLAIQLLLREGSPIADDLALVKRLMVPQTSLAVQRALVARLADCSDLAIGDLLLTGWQAHSPTLRSEILNLLTSRDIWAESLRQHLIDGTLLPAELSPTIQQRLLSSGENQSKWQQALAIESSTARADVLQRYQAALQLKGDAQRGATLFRKNCIMCHKFKEEGHEVGPNLAAITNKKSEALLVAILDPNEAVEAKYLTYLVVTQQGRGHSGMLATETGSSITLLAAEGKRETILRGDIDQLHASTQSLMPEGLEKELQPQDLADLIQFIQQELR